MKFLNKKMLLLLALSQIAGVGNTALANEQMRAQIKGELNGFKSRLAKDRKQLFYNLCMDLIDKDGINKTGTCRRYSNDIEGENFEQVRRSMNKQFALMDRRSVKIPRYVVLSRHLRSEFEDLYGDNGKYKTFFLEGSQAYVKEFYPDYGKEPEPAKPEVPKDPYAMTEGEMDLVVSNYDNEEGRADSYERRLMLDTPVVVSAICKIRVREDYNYARADIKKCEQMGRDFKGKSLGNIHQDMNDSKDPDIDVSMDLLKEAYTRSAIKFGYDGDVLDGYVDFLNDSAKIVDRKVVEAPVVKVLPPLPKPVPAKPVVPVAPAPVEKPAPVVAPAKPVVPQGEIIIEAPKEVVEPEITNPKPVVPKDSEVGDVIDPNSIPLTEEDLKLCENESEDKYQACINTLKRKKMAEMANGNPAPVEVEEKPKELVLENIVPKLLLSDEEKEANIKFLEELNKIKDKDFQDKVSKIIKKYDDLYNERLKAECAETPTQECADKVYTDVTKQRIAELKKLYEDYLESQKEPVVEQPEVVDPPTVFDESDVSKLSCDDQISNKILELLKKDQFNMIGKQFQLTSLKLALQVLQKSAKYDTVEDYLNKYQKSLLSQDNKAVYDELVEFYRDHGKIEDSNFIANNFEKLKNSSYWKENTRIYNETASVFILADSLSNENSKFSELDAATTWFAEQVNKKFKIGSYHNNLTNLTSLTYRQLGVLKKERPIKLANLERRIKEKETELDGKFEDMRGKVILDLAHCFKNGSACLTKDAFNEKFSTSIMDLTNKLKTDDNFNVEMDRSLKGTLGGEGFRIDFLPRDRDI